jgi:predicted alpha/beta superfamily hydrolase
MLSIVRQTLVMFLVLSLGIHTGNGQGRIIEPLEMPSRHIGGTRTVRIYLPASYGKQSDRRFPVLYLHDGQNVFSTAGTNTAFGWGSWELDKTVDQLCHDGKMQEIIMVAVDNSAARYAEYCGKTSAPSSATNTAFESYAAFLMEELKPRVDREYRTQPEPANTGTMGSSLGGICSMALAWQHPEVFGRAASLSGAFQVERTNFLKQVLQTYHGKPKPVRLYLDSGMIDFTGGDDGCALTREVSKQFSRIGWKIDLMHYIDTKPLTISELKRCDLRQDKWSEAQSSQHNEFYWRFRSWRALTFLFPSVK